jgi:prepilin-type N-terminal cleavage/methylation domain-containing protein
MTKFPKIENYLIENSMKIVNCKLEIDRRGFTLIEIMVAIAIIGIMAAVVLVSMQSYGIKARSAKAIAQASSAVASMVGCWGNAGTVNNPNTHGGNDICSGMSGFGAWPDMTQIDYSYSGVTGTSSSDFFFTVTGDSLIICCNSTMNSCGQVSSCSATTTW